MRKIQIALYDKEGYMPCLVDYLCKKGHSMMETRLFTSKERLIERAEAGKIDVLLAGEEVAGEIRSIKDRIPQIILLSEGNQVSERSEYDLVFKYQSAQEIVKEVLAKVAEDDRIIFTQTLTAKRQIKLVGVYAPFGGSGVTECALSVAERLAQKGKVLYVSLELFHGLDFLPFPKKEKEEIPYRGMSEVIFYLKQRKEKLALKLETVVTSLAGVDYIFAVEDYRDLYSLSCEEMACLLEVLLQQTDYESVVFDIGCLSETSLYLMEQCSELYMPCPVTNQQQSKNRAFQRFLLREHHEQILELFQQGGEWKQPGGKKEEKKEMKGRR